MSAMLLWTLAAAPRVTRAVAAQCWSISVRACTDVSSCACRPKEPTVSSHSADRTSSGIAGVAAQALAATMAAPPGLSAAGSADDLTTMTAALDCPATADDAGGVTGNAPSISGTYVYGYDSDGNPTLTDARS